CERITGVEIGGKSLATITAAALVFRAAAAYLGLATNVSWPGPALSIPATPVIAGSGEPDSSRKPSAAATSESFIALCGQIVKESQRNSRFKAARTSSRQDKYPRPLPLQ